MSKSDFTDHPLSQDACGCCEGVGSQSPARVYNRPGLSAVAYRIGDHGTILATLLARLSSKDYPALAKLRTRDRDDFSIALLDAYACMADVLSFYQERIANESYLRTAAERLSMQELARLISYRLNPGVAAETYLAFMVETAAGAPEEVRLPAGIKVQSVPGQDEKPQTFETIEKIEARAEWNILQPRMSEMKVPVFGTDTIYLQGTATQLKAGDALLFVGSERESDSGSERWDFRRIRGLEVDSVAGMTKVILERGLGSVFPHVDPAANPEVYALRLRASLFGYNAPDWRIMSEQMKRGYLGMDADDATGITDTEWPGFTIADISDPPVGTASGTGLYAEYFDTKELSKRKLTRIDPTVNFDWGTGSPDPSIGADTFSVRWTGWVQAPATGTYTFYTRSDDGVRLWVDDQLIINNWSVHAVEEDSGTMYLNEKEKVNIRLEFYENGVNAVIQLYWAYPGQSKQIIPEERLYPRNIHTLHLDAVYPGIVPGSWLVLSIPEYQELYSVTSAGEDSRASFTLTGKTTRLQVKGENLREKFNDQVRETAVFAQSEKLTLANTPVIDNVSGWSLAVEKKVEGLLPDHKLLLCGETVAGVTNCEALTVAKSEPDGAATKIHFTSQLQQTYKRKTVKVYANVAVATHGETVHQILGSGAAQTAHQRFALKHVPLTFVSADNESGAEAALQVRVNDIAWHEVSSLYGAGPDDRSYVVRMDEDGGGEIQFGDGRRGARLSTGQENVLGIYRKGLGSAGNLKAGQLSQLLTRPLGLKEVTNPQVASGGVDAESVQDARRNMPLGVRTLGRAVSLRDYEDYARAYTGIAKARAEVLNLRAIRTIFITVAGKNAVQPESGGPTLTSLLNSLKKNSDPLVACTVAAYNQAYFKLALRIKRHPDHAIERVLADVEAALRAAFSFDVRDFGQSVARSEIITIAQQVQGVEGVDVDRLYRGTVWALESRLVPEPAFAGSDGNGVAAELLLLDPGPFDYLEEMP